MTMNIKVDLSTFIKNKKRFALIHINPDYLKTVSDVIIHIFKIFGIQIEPDESDKNTEQYSFYEGIWYIHPNQSSHIFKGIEGILRLCHENEEKDASSWSSRMHHELEVEMSLNNHEETEDINELVSNTNLLDGLETELLVDEHSKPNEEYVEDKEENLLNGNIEILLHEPKNGDCEMGSEKMVHNDIHSVEMDEPSNDCSREATPHKSEEECEEPNSVCLTEDLLETPLKTPLIRKRKRKHYKKKKSNLKTEKYSNKWLKPNRASNFGNAHSEYGKEKFYVSYNRSHKIFDESDEEEKKQEEEEEEKENSVLNTQVLNITHTSVDSSNSKCTSHKNKVQIICHSTPTPNSYNLNGNVTRTNGSMDLILVQKDPHTSSEELENNNNIESKSNPKSVSNQDGVKMARSSLPSCSYNVSNQDGVKMARSSLPSCSYNVDKTSPVILLKFKNLLALEERLKPKIFLRNRNYHKTSQEKRDSLGETWDSLPESFVSRKHKTGFNHHNSTLTDCFHSNPTAHDISDISSGESSKCAYSESSQEQKHSHALENFIGAKPPKGNHRRYYYQSVGNVLNIIKNVQNTSNVDSKGIEHETQISASNCGTQCVSITENAETRKIPSDSSSSPRINLIHDKNDDSEKMCIFSKDGQIYGECGIERTNSGKGVVSMIEGEIQFCGESNDTTSCKKENNFGLKEILENKDSQRTGNKSSYEMEEKEIIIKDSDFEITFMHLETPHSSCDNTQTLKKENINYESYPILLTLPKVADIIATKLLSLDANMCPCYSDYRPAKVLSLDGLKLRLQFLDDLSAKTFDLLEDCGDSKNCTVIDWRDLKFPRLIFP